MTSYQQLVHKLAAELAPVDRAREEALATSRRLVRAASRRIHDLHRGNVHRAERKPLERDAQHLSRLHRRFPALRSIAVPALAEYVEARLLEAYIRGESPPAPHQLKVPAESYLQGVGDLVGELRRLALSRLLRNDLEGALSAFEQMEKIYEALVDSNIPEGLVGLRPKIDAARGLVEKTRGDLVTTKKAKDLEKKIDGVHSLLDEAEGRPPRRKGKPDSGDLDLDAAWNKT